MQACVPGQGLAILQIDSKHLFLVGNCRMPAHIVVWYIEFLID